MPTTENDRRGTGDEPSPEERPLRLDAQADLAPHVDRARAAQRLWARTAPAQRRELVEGLRARLVTAHDGFARLQSMATGETLVDVAMGDLDPLLSLLSALPRDGARLFGSVGPLARLRGTPSVSRLPVGVVGLSVGAKARLLDLLAPAATALFAGNAVVFAGREANDPVASACVDLLREQLAVVGASEALVVYVSGVERSPVLLDAVGVDALWSSNRSRAAGLSMSIAADADLDLAESRAMGGAFASAGGARLPVRRVYAAPEIHAALVARLTAAVAAMRLGPANGPRLVDCAEASQPADLARVDELLGDAVARGARILVGGDHVESLGARFYRPTLLVDVDPSMRIARESFGGPVLCLMRCGLTPPAGRVARLELSSRGACMEMADPERAGWALGALAVPEALRACTRAQVRLDDPNCPPRRSYPIRATSYPMLRELAGIWYGAGARTRLTHAFGAVRLLAEERLARISGAA